MRYCSGGVMRNPEGRRIGNCVVVYDPGVKKADLFLNVGDAAEYFHQSRMENCDSDEVPVFENPGLVFPLSKMFEIVIEHGRIVKRSRGAFVVTSPMESWEVNDFNADLVDYRYNIWGLANHITGSSAFHFD